VYAPIAGQAGLKLLVPDTLSSYVYGGIVPGTGRNGSIIRNYYSGATPSTIVSGLPSLNAFTVDSSYLYWTESDGRVRRATKS
jgi:hypothetical protein